MAQKPEKTPPRYRHENKYWINAAQEKHLLVRCWGVLQSDPHVGKDGGYLVRSVYFDDMWDSCYYENENGTDPRSKFRIRYYGSETKRIVLEKKSKCRGVGRKESCRLSLEECKTFLSGKTPTITEDMPSMKKKLYSEVEARGLRAKVIVTYERIPFICQAGNVRITFDRAITSSNQLDRYLTGDYDQRPVLPKGMSILEVKWDELLPGYIRDTLQLGGLGRTAFSKYYMCRRFHL